VIHVSRDIATPPASLRSAEVLAAEVEARAHFKRRDAQSRQSLHDFPPLWNRADVQEALTALFHGKCAFCESPYAASAPTDIHHFRPLQGALDPVDGRVSRGHYWWLAYVWDNLYPTCGECHQAAGPRFPTRGPRAGTRTTGARLLSEGPILLDPCRDEPERSLRFTRDGMVWADDERGSVTIDTYALNRPGLVEARERQIRRMTAAAARTSPEELRATYGDPAAPYAGAVRQLIAAPAAPRPRRLAAPPEPAPGSTETGAPALVRRVTIRNFRAIKHLELDFTADFGGWTMLLGENGDGKTSVLQALAVVLMDAPQRGKLDARQFLEHHATSGSVEVEFGAGAVRSVSFDAQGKTFRSEGDGETIVAGYGAYRLPARAGPKAAKPTVGVPRVDSLLDPYAYLIASEPWLLEATPPTFDAAARALKRLLVDEDSVLRQHKRQRRVLFDRDDDSSVALDQLSAGYLSMVALAVDLMSYMLTRWDSLEAAEGVVLIDELGTHLHPRWQMRIVSAFRQAFPRLQFIVSTHDPLCLRGLRDGEVIVLRREPPSDDVVAVTDLPSVDGLYVDQLLTSEHFGLGSTLDPELEEMFEEYYALLSKRRATAAQQRRIDELRDALADRRQLGFTERERLALETADQALARKRTTADRAEREAITTDAEERIARVWAQAGL
jgi:uncharacterized protein (TIGR02646 family)